MRQEAAKRARRKGKGHGVSARPRWETCRRAAMGSASGPHFCRACAGREAPPSPETRARRQRIRTFGADRGKEPCGMAGRHPFSRRLDTDPLPRSIPSDRDRWRGGCPQLPLPGEPRRAANRSSNGQGRARSARRALPMRLRPRWQKGSSLAPSPPKARVSAIVKPLSCGIRTQEPLPFGIRAQDALRLFGWVFRSPSVRWRACRKIVRKWTRNRALARKGGVWKPL